MKHKSFHTKVEQLSRLIVSHTTMDEERSYFLAYDYAEQINDFTSRAKAAHRPSQETFIDAVRLYRNAVQVIRQSPIKYVSYANHLIEKARVAHEELMEEVYGG